MINFIDGLKMKCNVCGSELVEVKHDQTEYVMKCEKCNEIRFKLKNDGVSFRIGGNELRRQNEKKLTKNRKKD